MTLGLFLFPRFLHHKVLVLEVDAVRDEAVVEHTLVVQFAQSQAVNGTYWIWKSPPLSHLLLVAVALLPSTCLRNQFDWRALCDLTPSRSPSILSHTGPQCILCLKKPQKSKPVFDELKIQGILRTSYLKEIGEISNFIIAKSLIYRKIGICNLKTPSYQK